MPRPPGSSRGCCISRRHVQGALQLGVGYMLVSLNVVVKPIAFPTACLGVVTFALCRLLLAADLHVGTALHATAVTLGAYTFGIISGGVVATIAVATGPSARVPVLCVLGALGLLVLMLGRPITKVASLGQMCMVACFWYGSTLILCVHTPNVGTVWSQPVLRLLLVGLLPALYAVVVALVLLPSSAAHELQQQTAAAVRLLGHELSECSSLMFIKGEVNAILRTAAHKSSKIVHFDDRRAADAPACSSSPLPSDGAGGAAVPVARAFSGLQQRSMVVKMLDWLQRAASDEAPKGEGAPLLESLTAADIEGCVSAEEEAAMELLQEVQEFVHEEPDDVGFLEMLRHNTRPLTEVSARPKYEARLQSKIKQLRSQLARAKDCVFPAQSEPMVYSGFHPAALAQWPPLLAAANVLVMRLSALLGMVAQEGHLLGHAELESIFPGELSSKFKQVIALLATHCACLATSLSSGRGSSTRTRGHAAGQHTEDKATRNVDWVILRAELRDIMLDSTHAFWRRVEAHDAHEPIRLIRSIKVQNLMFTWTLVDGIMQTMEALERHVHAIEHEQRPLLPPPAVSPASNIPVVVVVASTATAPTPTAPPCDPEADQPPAPRRSLNLGRLHQRRISLQLENSFVHVPSAPSAAGSGGMSWRAWLQAQVAFLPGLLPLVLCVPVFRHIRQTLGPDLVAMLSSTQALTSTFKSRVFQAGLKYFLTLSAFLVCILLTTAYSTFFVEFTQLFAYAICSVVLYDKVESTLWRMLLRISGAILGATVSFVFMMFSATAGNPWAVVLCIGGFTALLAPLAESRYRVALVLTMYTAHAVILCQYKGEGTHGTALYYAQRIISLAAGCIIPTIITALVLPWYVSEDALEQLAACFQSATLLMTAQYDSYYATLLAARHRQDGTSPGSTGPDAVPADTGVPPVPFACPTGSRTLSLVALLTSVQLSLDKESVVWRRGPLVAPPLLQQLLAAQLLLADRLSALELALAHMGSSEACLEDGRALDQFGAPMHDPFLEVLSKLRDLSKTTAAVVLESASRSSAPSQRPELQQRIEALETARVHLHARFRHLRARSFLIMKASAALLAAESRRDIARCTADLTELVGQAEVVKLLELKQRPEHSAFGQTGRDTAIFFSFLFAFNKTLDAMLVVARTVLVQPPMPNAWWAWLSS